ncbi:ATP-grasp domain-containing protein [Pelomicrobium sp. G1]|uniref:ATP-grasp domain-containing protein n=1 Tax=unclassified Pelomicrobium TaxID=2815318 RepID=UPI0021DC9A27|nr:MAG: lysine biosynthesis protein LysX [Burkholderiales bacterium]
MTRRVAIVTDGPGWHGARLKRAFQARGLKTCYVRLAECRLDLAAAWHGIVMPGFERQLPEAVFVKSVPGGTLEQVVWRLDVLHALREVGVPVYNDARAIERTVDKAMTSFLLRRAGVPTPPTWVVESREQARAVLDKEAAAGHQVVIKPLFGSRGVGLRRLGAGTDMPDLAEYHGVAYLQRYIDSGEGRWHDYRVFVVGGAAVAAMRRWGTSWVSNAACGARCEAVALEPALARLACDAARAVEADYAGVDVIVDRQGDPYVIEVNGMPAWRSLQGATGVPIARFLVDDLVSRRSSVRLEAAG